MVRTIWSFVGAAIAIVSGLSAVHVWRHYEDQLAANITLVRTATAMSQSRISAAILSIDMVLSETGRDLVAGKLDDRAAAADRLKTRKDAFPDIRHLFVVGTNGASLLGTIPSAVGTEISDRDYFRRALSAPRAAMVISEPLGSRIEPVTSIFLARQVRDAANSVRGGVVAALDPVFFEKNLRSVFTETGHHAAIIRRDGVVLARVPDPAEWLGKTLTGSDLFRHVQQGATGTFVGPTFGDGTRRITGYADIPGHDAIVCLSLSYHDALASWRSSAVVIGCANLAFIATALFLAFSLSRRRGEEERALALVAAAEAKAALQAERLDLALRGANDSWWDWDLKADKAYYSPRWFAMIGYRPDELEADSGLWRRQMHPDDQAGVDRVIAEVVRTRSEAVELEFRLRHRMAVGCRYSPVAMSSTTRPASRCGPPGPTPISPSANAPKPNCGPVKPRSGHCSNCPPTA
jgi:PAS domain-containing protein